MKGSAIRDTDFPAPPVSGSGRLVPIESWAALHDEATLMGIEFDAFWYEQVHAGVAYFFRWLEQPRQTILAVWGDARLTHVESRLAGDIEPSEEEARGAMAEVRNLFLLAGFEVNADDPANH